MSNLHSKLCTIALFSILFLSTYTSVFSLEPEPGAVFVRVVDTGAGLATITLMPGGHYMVYDAGHWHGVNVFMERLRELIPSGETIDLLVLSHSDADHQGAVKDILDEYTVSRVIRTGWKGNSTTWENANNSINQARNDHGTIDINLKYFDFPDGATYKYGDVFVTKVTGIHQAPVSWDLKSDSERNNANSIIIRLYFHSKSILFTGDAVGRHNDQVEDIPIATEKLMIENSPVILLDSDVLIAPHHGADNGSSTAFIQAVSPEWVVFSAGHDHNHPKKAAADRYLNRGVDINKMLRTDKGDDEPGTKEWKHESIPNRTDPRGDDDVDILIRPDGEILVEYRND